MLHTRSTRPQGRGPGNYRFGKNCGCLNHETFIERSDVVENFLVNVIDGKKAKTAVKNVLLKRGLIQIHTKYVCVLCLQYVEDNLLDTFDEDIPERDDRLVDVDANMDVSEDAEYFMDVEEHNCVQTVIEMIHAGRLSKDELASLSFALGLSQKKNIQDEIEKQRRSYLDITKLSNEDLVQDQIQSSNPVVHSFISGATGDSNNPKKAYSLLKAIDQIYFTKDLTFVSLASFSESLVSYNITGSKLDVLLRSSGSPSGSYRTILDWHENFAATSNGTPQGEVVICFDNDQVLGKNYRVHLNSKLNVSVVTTACAIKASSDDSLQKRCDLTSLKWSSPLVQGLPCKGEDILSAIRLFDVKLHQFFNDVKKRCVQHFLKKLTETSGASQINDIKAKGAYEIQFTDGVMEQRKLSETCDPFSFLAKGHEIDDLSVTVLEPFMANPNSFKNVALVAEHLKETAVTESGRQWVSVVCDGLPYTILRKLMSADPKKYEWMLLRPGGGHFEINMFRSYFDIYWEVFLKDLAFLLGFKSQAAQTYCKRALDHHKTWDIIRISFEGNFLELLSPYVEYCKKHNMPASADGFEEWRAEVKNPNYILMAEATFEFLTAIVIFRAGIRRNNQSAMMSARRAFNPIWFARNHPYYRMIEAYDIIDRVHYPEEISEHVRKTDSITNSGDDLQGECPDFVLETINKEVKKWLPARPQAKHWERSCNNHGKLQNIREAVVARSGAKSLQNKTTKRSPTSIEQEVAAWRAYLKEKEYFSSDCLTSVSGQALDVSMLQIITTGNDNQQKYIHGLSRKTPEELQLVYVTPTEREKAEAIQNQTKPKIITNIKEIISTLNTAASSIHFGEVLSKLAKTGKKQELLELYYEVDECYKAEQEEIVLEH